MILKHNFANRFANVQLIWDGAMLACLVAPLQQHIIKKQYRHYVQFHIIPCRKPLYRYNLPLSF